MEFRIGFPEVAARMLDVFDNRNLPSFPDSTLVSRWQGKSDRYSYEKPEKFLGATVAEMREWIANGFHAGEFEGPDFPVTGARSRKLAYSDEDGELQVDLALSGHDFPYLTWGTRNRKPGLLVEIGFSFSAFVPASTIAEYGAWVARLLARLEIAGYSLGVAFVMETTGTYKGGKEKISLDVKEENEGTDFSSWSVLFSPGGYRYLGFLAKVLVGNRERLPISTGLGTPIPREWGIDFDPDNRVLKIRNGTGRGNVKFPEAILDEELSNVTGI